MELNEKLQELRKSKGMTQEELAEILYVSRTAISKWESGRGTPSIESLKQISAFFSVSIDDLLSAEKALSLAEREHKVLQQNQIHLWTGILDICSAGLIFLPLYPNVVCQTVYAVNLLSYANRFNRSICALLFLTLILTGVSPSIIPMCYTAPAFRHGRLAFLRFWSQSAAVRQVLLVRMTTLQEDNWRIIENESNLFMSVA